MLAESGGAAHIQRMSVLRMPVVIALAALLAAACQPTPKPAPKPVMASPKPIMVAPEKPVEVPCEVTDTCPAKPKPPAPFNIMGKVLGDACPKKSTLLAAYASCRNGQITAINIAIPTPDMAAKQRVFDRALEKYGAPYEDRHGGVPMIHKVRMPDWAADKTPPHLAETRDKRFIFWWIDEVAKHYLAVSETDNTVEVQLHRLDREARQRANNLKIRTDKLVEQGKALTDAF